LAEKIAMAVVLFKYFPEIKFDLTETQIEKHPTFVEFSPLVVFFLLHYKNVGTVSFRVYNAVIFYPCIFIQLIFNYPIFSEVEGETTTKTIN